jgi:hypothetical protein
MNSLIEKAGPAGTCNGDSAVLVSNNWGWLETTHHWQARRRKGTVSSHDSTSYAQAVDSPLKVSVRASGYPETSKTVNRLGKLTGEAGRLTGIPKGRLSLLLSGDQGKQNVYVLTRALRIKAKSMGLNPAREL